MAEKDETQLPDQTDNPFGGEETDPDSDALAKMVSEALDADEADPEFMEGDLDASEAEDPRVSEDAGNKMVSDAKDGVTDKAEKPEAPEEAKAEKAEEPETEAEKPGDEKDEKPEEPKPQTFDDIVGALPEAQRAIIAERTAKADAVMSIFETPENKASLQQHGMDAPSAIKRLVELNSYATQKPEEYLAWAAGQLGADKATDLIKGVAKHFGLEIKEVETESEDEDDPFADPTTTAINKENAELKRKLAAYERTQIGPDSPERVQARQQSDLVAQNQVALNAFIEEKGEDGQLKRPHFNIMAPVIHQKGMAHLNATGKPPTLADLDRFYRETMEAVNPAAPATPSVEQQIKDKADAAAKAQRASKSQGGGSQGASHQPRPPGDGDLEATIQHFLDQASG